MVSSGWLVATEDARVEGRYLNKEACSSAVNRMVPGDLSPQTILLGSGAAFLKAGILVPALWITKWVRGSDLN